MQGICYFFIRFFGGGGTKDLSLFFSLGFPAINPKENFLFSCNLFFNIITACFFNLSKSHIYVASSRLQRNGKVNFLTFSKFGIRDENPLSYCIIK